jgi:hypothetical protein
MRRAREGWPALHRRRSLVVFVVAFVFAAFNAADAMASPSGGIAGTVTNAVTNAPISHIVACVREAGGSHKEDCGESRESGEYEITGVTPGQYKVLFYPVGLAQYDIAQYLSQYYPGVPTWSAAAQPVSVVGGAVTPGINARMQEGGWVAGTVTAAGTGTSLEGVEVCARNESGPWLISSCTDTKAHGEYGYFFALEPGTYKIEFRPSEKMGYQLQYYNDVPLLSEAQSITIEAGKTITGIDAALQPASAAAGEGEPPEEPSSPAPFPNGTGGTGPVTAPYLGAANNELNAIAVHNAERRAKEREAEEQKAREATASYTAEQTVLEQRQAAMQAAARAAAKHPECVVPSLKGDTLSTARRALVKTHCRLGKVLTPRRHHKTLLVAGQGTKSGRTLPDGSAIAVKLARIT